MKLDGIQAARGLAALLVVLRHATVILPNHVTGAPAFGGFFMFGRAGVEFFFVLSGFIMMHVHRSDLGMPIAFFRFWRKRLVRIYPPYWVATVIFGAILAFSPTQDKAEQSVLHWLLSLSLLPEMHTPILDVGWSLRHEMLFYLLFSLAIINRATGFVLMALWCSGIVGNLTYTLVSGTPLFGGQLNQWLFRGFNIEFFFGMAIAVLVRRPSRYPVAFLTIGSAMFLANGLLESFGPVATEWPPRVIVYALASSLILYGTSHLDRARAWSVPRPLLVLGAASYSVYLVHVTILLILNELFRRMAPSVALPTEIVFVLAVSIAVIGGICFSMLFERPIMLLGQRAVRAA